MRKHFLYYFSLLLILIIGFSTAFYLSGQKTLQMAIIVLTAFFYVVWGVVHHMLHHSFSVKIMLEYIAIAVLGISLVLFVQNIAL